MLEPVGKNQLHAAMVAAGHPVVSITVVNGQTTAILAAGSTQEQQTAANAFVAGFDLSDSAVAARLSVGIRTTAQAALDSQKSDLIVIQRAALIELLTYSNNKLTLIADTLRSKGVITLAERNNFVNGLATVQQGITAVKNRIAAGEADGA